MCAIFYFSSRTAAESSAQSDAVKAFLIKVFIVRKSAHFLEYTGLGLLFALAFYIHFGKPKTLLAVVCSSAYAVTDEIHQLFVEGRACKFADWGIDTAGAVAGALFILAVISIADRYRSNRKKGIDRTIK